MAVEEEMFNKEVDKVVKKPKRKLTEKQLANLALGREKMRLKRELAKKNKEQKDNLKQVKTSDKVAKEGQKEKKKAHKVKRRTMKEINAEKEQQILDRLQKEETDKTSKRSARMDLYTSLKVKCLEKAKSIQEYTDIKGALDGIDEDTLHCDDKLKAYAMKVMKPYMTKKEAKAENLKMETEEIQEEDYVPENK